MPVQSYLAVVARHWKLLVVITVIPTIVALILVLFILRPVYEGRASVILPLKRATSFMARSLSQLDIPIAGMSSILDPIGTIYNHIAILESRTLALRVYDYLLKEKNLDILATYPDILKDPDLDTQDKKLVAMAKRMQKRVRVDDADRGLAEVVFLHTDPVIAAEVANAYVTETLNFLNNLQQTTHSDLAIFLEARLNEVEANLKGIEAKIQEHKEKTGILAVEEGAAQLIKSYADIMALTAEAEIDYEGSKALARNMEKAGMDMRDYYSWLASGEKMQGSPPPPAVESLADPTIAKLRSDLDALELKRQQMSLYTTPENPEVKSVELQIQSIQQELYREFSDYYDAAVSSLMVEAASYQAQLNVSNKILSDLDKKLEAFPPEERRLIELERDRDVQESIYLVIAQELEQARIQKMRRDTPFTILDTALVPHKPVRPRKLMVTFGTLAISFWIGILVIFRQDAMHRAGEVRG